MFAVLVSFIKSMSYANIYSSNYWQNICIALRWGWVFLERTRILSGIQFTTHFIEFFVVETKRLSTKHMHCLKILIFAVVLSLNETAMCVNTHCTYTQRERGGAEGRGEFFHTLTVLWEAAKTRVTKRQVSRKDVGRGGGLGSRPKKMYGERLGDGVEYHLMCPTPRC